jgi:cell division protein FtsI (penicillin-binding protein 3)
MIERKDFIRFAIFGSFIVIVILLIIWKYFSLMVLNRSSDDGAQPASVTERGPILDRNGRVLAVETRENSVSAWMPNVEDKTEIAKDLSGILDMSTSDILDKLDSHSGFVYIKRKISQSQSDQIQSLVSADKLKGIELEPEYARVYPQGELAGHVLGYVGTDNDGLAGIEYSFNNVLSPPAGKNGAPQFGDQVYLTIDMNIQYFAQQFAKQVYDDTKADSVILLVMQAKTGDILGYVSFPEFDPNTFADYPATDRMNRPIQYIYEPGSVLKIFTISSFLQLGGITSTTQFYDDGTYVNRLPNGTVIKINGLAPHGYETPRLIIKYSSNVGAAYSSDTVSDQAFYSMLKNFGFGSPTYVNLPGETSGILRTPDEWTPRSKPTIAFGQEIGVSAMQIVSAATALANDGVLLKPHIVQKVVTPDGAVVQSFPREPIRQVISPEVSKEMLSYMESATDSGGTAVWAKIPGVDTSAKTGTSNIFDPKTGKYSDTAYVASTIAMFPTEDPQLIVYSVIINPKQGSIYGARVAAPIVRDVSERLVSYLDVPKSNDQIVEHSGTVSVDPDKPIAVGAALPDLTGLSKRELLPLINDPDITVNVSGNGWVVSQNPAPGTPIAKGMTVTVQLK